MGWGGMVVVKRVWVEFMEDGRGGVKVVGGWVVVGG